jgi:hypothetical protein
MRKLTLVTAMLLLSSGAFADGSRGLSMPQPGVQQATGQQSSIRRAEVTILPGPAEQPAVTSPPSMEDKLRAAGELRPDGTPVRQPQPQIRALTPPAPVPTQAAVQTQPTPAAVQTQPTPAPVHATAPAPAPVHATAPAAAKRVAHAHKPAKKRVARRESTERKARRFAARFGIYW